MSSDRAPRAADDVVRRVSYLAPIVFGLVASLPWMFGCAVYRPVWIAEGQAGSPDVEAVVLLPLNAVVPLPVEFESVAERVEAEIRRYLAEAHGKRVATPSPDEWRRLWVRSIGEVEARPDAPKGFEAAVRVLTMKLRRRYALDALVIDPAHQLVLAISAHPEGFRLVGVRYPEQTAV